MIPSHHSKYQWLTYSAVLFIHTISYQVFILGQQSAKPLETLCLLRNHLIYLFIKVIDFKQSSLMCNKDPVQLVPCPGGNICFWFSVLWIFQQNHIPKNFVLGWVGWWFYQQTLQTLGIGISPKPKLGRALLTIRTPPTTTN